MKKITLSIICMTVLLALVLTGCGSSEPTRQITVINYGMYLDPAILDQFTAETGIEVLYEEAMTPEELYSKYSSGAIQYDAVCSSEYIIMKLMSEGELQTIDFTQFPNIDNISDEIWKFCDIFDPGNQYALPYFWGTVGLLYNKNMVTEPPTSWKVLFDGSYAGNIIMQNSMRDAFMIALKYQGYSCNTQDSDELMQARDLLIAQKPDVQSYLVDEARDEMIAENAAIAVVYSGDGLLGCVENENLEYVLPEDGSNFWVDCWAVTKNCEDTEAMYMFLDYICCRTDIAAQNFEYVYYAPSNAAVRDLLDEEDANNPLLFPDFDTLDGCEVFQLMDDETTELMNQYWKEIKAE